MTIESINLDDCIGCGECVLSCPMNVIQLDAIPNEKREISPCSKACPLGVNQRRYHDLIKQDRLDQASEILMLDHPMPSITGRLCPHPCETECSRNIVDEAVNINGLEQYLGDYTLNLDPIIPSDKNNEKIAVIGSGPAGLSAAYYFSLAGYNVTVFEKDDKPGGLLRSAIPNFRLPEDVLDKQIKLYEKMGITFRTGMTLGKEVKWKELEQQGYKAFIAATGASKALGLSAEGSDAKGIISAMDFLVGVKSGQIKKVSGKVAVIGGGSVAFDAARSAVRLGADEVNIVCLERLESNLKDSMLALTEDIDDAVAEGIKIHPSRGADSFTVKDGHVTGIRCVECLSVRDEDGRFNPAYGDCTLPQEIEAEMVILAIGQKADPATVPEGFPVSPTGLIISDNITCQAAQSLFAAGDAVTGPSTVVEALAAGKRAALTIDRYLKGKDMTEGLDIDRPLAETPPEEKIPEVGRINRKIIPAEDRKTNFKATILQLTWNEARMESTRCLTCGNQSKIIHLDDCQTCWLCHAYCPVEAITMTPVKMIRPMTGWG